MNEIISISITVIYSIVLFILVVLPMKIDFRYSILIGAVGFLFGYVFNVPYYSISLLILIVIGMAGYFSYTLFLQEAVSK